MNMQCLSLVKKILTIVIISCFTTVTVQGAELVIRSSEPDPKIQRKLKASPRVNKARMVSVLPDFSILSLSVSPQAITIGERIKVIFVVSNNSKSEAKNVTIGCFNGTKVLGRKQVTLQGGQKKRFDMSVQPNKIGRQAIEVVADPGKKIKETDENNNSKKAYIAVNKVSKSSKDLHSSLTRPGKVKKSKDIGKSSAPPLSQYSGDLVPISLIKKQSAQAKGTRSVFEASVKNNSSGYVKNISVALYVGNKKLASQKIAISPYSTKSVLFKVDLKSSRLQDVVLKIDPDKTIPERNRRNNEMKLQLNNRVSVMPASLASGTGGQQVNQNLLGNAAPDLYLQNTLWSKKPVHGETIGQSSAATFSIINKGNAKSAPSMFEVIVEDVPATIVPFDKKSLEIKVLVPELKPGQLFNIAWPSMSGSTWVKGEYRIRTEIDFVPAESDEMNNIKIVTFTCENATMSIANESLDAIVLGEDKPDLIARINPQTGPFYFGQEYIFIGWVENVGSKKSEQVIAQLHLSYKNGWIILGNVAIPPLSKNKGFGFEFKVKATLDLEYDSIRVIADKNDELEESNETNNVRELPITFLKKSGIAEQLATAEPKLQVIIEEEPSQVSLAGPDLVVTLESNGSIAYNGQTIFNAVVTNIGTEPANEALVVLVARNESGTKFKILESFKTQALGPGMGQVFQMSGTATSKQYRKFAAVVDFTHLVDETNELNNTSELIPIEAPQWPDTDPQ